LEQNKSQQIEHITRLEQNVQLIQKEKDTIVQQLQSTLSHLHVKLEHRVNDKNHKFSLKLKKLI